MAYELVFVGGSPIDHRRDHEIYDAAESEAHRVLYEFDMRAMNERGAHPAIIYGPDCGPHGVTLR